ncbi:hypothetical protein Leryth_011317 [Lithospermum erythrorhizon]|nr:hypothetical protein Leryth_011317 [Lithospermum erythrorhizon]
MRGGVAEERKLVARHGYSSCCNKKEKMTAATAPSQMGGTTVLCDTINIAMVGYLNRGPCLNKRFRLKQYICVVHI